MNGGKLEFVTFTGDPLEATKQANEWLDQNDMAIHPVANVMTNFATVGEKVVLTIMLHVVTPPGHGRITPVNGRLAGGVN